MSRRSRGQMALQQHRAKSDDTCITSRKNVGKDHDTKTTLTKLIESPVLAKPTSIAQISKAELNPNRFNGVVSKLISCFKTMNIVVTSFVKKRKQCTWDALTESFQAISSSALTLDDLLFTLSVWGDAFTARWQPKNVDSMQNILSYELIVDLPEERLSNVSSGSSSSNVPDVGELNRVPQDRVATFR
jgi:hypothetical protein